MSIDPKRARKSAMNGRSQERKRVNFRLQEGRKSGKEKVL